MRPAEFIIIIIIIIIIAMGNVEVYCSEYSQAVTSCPSAKGRLETEQSCGKCRRLCDLRTKSRTGKSVLLQAWSDPEGSRKLRFPGYMTTAQDGGKVVSLPHRPPLPPGNIPGTYFC